jgi:hypothetical protein
MYYSIVTYEVKCETGCVRGTTEIEHPYLFTRMEDIINDIMVALYIEKIKVERQYIIILFFTTLSQSNKHEENIQIHE